VRFIIGLLAIAAIVVGCDDGASSSEPRRDRTAGVYLSVGDSIAAGNGSSDPNTASFPALVAEARGLALENLAVPGATTSDVIDEQLPQVESAIAGREVALITVSAGGNDLAALIPNASCVEDPLPRACPLNDALASVEARLSSIVSTLRGAYPDAPLVLLAYPNFFSGTGHPFEAPAARVLPRFDDTAREVAEALSGVVVASPSFDGRGDELTHVLDPQFDPHPNDTGHRVIADAILDALDAPGVSE
jgi:lysophospholipase L1-like esterase